MTDRYFRPCIRAMAGYQPGEQPSDLARYIKLNTNENPYPPSPRVIEAIQREATALLRRYPPPLGDAFREKAAEVFGLEPDMILPGNGGDDILTIATRSFVDPGALVVTPTPSYLLYETLAQIQGARFRRVPFDGDWRLPDTFAEAEASLAFLGNPNSPSGTVLPAERVLELAGRLRCPLVLDEAYVDFADRHCLDLVRQSDRIIVLRSLSKGYSLAGLRFGFAVAPPDLIRGMIKVKDSYNCDRLSLAAATAAIADRAYLQECVGRIRATRQRLTVALRRLGFDVPDSQANFVWATSAVHDPKRLYETLKRRWILVRYMHYDGVAEGLRITVGTDAEIDALLEALAQIV